MATSWRGETPGAQRRHRGRDRLLRRRHRRPGHVLSGLDARFPAAIVLAQHVEPDRQQPAAAVLQRKTGLRGRAGRGRDAAGGGQGVRAARPTATSSWPGHGAGRRRMARGDPDPSVDRLLSSAAEAYDDRVVAVILSGNGSDGASGAVQVKQKGGTVVIQDPRTAAHPSMPAALPPTAVDHIADVEGIAGHPGRHPLAARRAGGAGRRRPRGISATSSSSSSATPAWTSATTRRPRCCAGWSGGWAPRARPPWPTTRATSRTIPTRWRPWPRRSSSRSPSSSATPRPSSS